MAQLLQATWVLALRDGWLPPWLDAHTSTLADETGSAPTGTWRPAKYSVR